MSQLSDFEFEEGEISEAPGVADLRAESAEAAPTAPVANAPATPVIVVEHRPARGLTTMLAPPALILLAALVITSYQRTQPVRYLTPRPVVIAPEPKKPTAAPDEKIVVHPAIHGEPIVEPVGASKETVAIASEKAVASAEPDPNRSPFEFDPLEPVKPEDKPIERAVPFDAAAKAEPLVKTEDVKAPAAAAAKVNAEAIKPPAEPKITNFDAPVPAPAEPAKEDILGDIERESKDKKAMQQNLLGQKQRADVEIFEDSLARVQADRAAFREDVDKAIKNLGNDAGAEIDRLCQQYGREPLPRAMVAYHSIQRMRPPRMTLAMDLDMMRTAGLPEAMVLDKLAERIKGTTMKRREGPRDPNEALVRAAKQLLAMPLKKPVKLALPAQFRDAPANVPRR